MEETNMALRTVANVTEELTMLQKAVEKYGAGAVDLTPVNTRLTNLETFVSQLGTTPEDLANIQSQIDAVKALAVAAEESGDITALQASVTTLTTNLSALTDRVTALETTVNALPANPVGQTALDTLLAAKANQTDLTALTGRVGTLETAVADVVTTADVITALGV